MNIGIDANCLIFEKAGIGKYTQNLIKNIIKIDGKNHYFLYFSYLRKRTQREKIIKDFLKPKPKNVTIKIIPLPARWYEFLTSTPLPINKIIKEPLDVFFSPYAAGIPKNGFPKMVVTIHDLTFLRFPEHRGRKLSNYYLRRHKIAIKNSQKIIVPSRSTREDLANFFKIKPQKIQVIYEAADVCFKVLSARNLKNSSKIISQYFDPKTQYILSVGTLEPRKNLRKLVEAYSLLPHSLQRVYKLVLVGGQGWNNQVLQKVVNNLNLKDKVILTGFVSDEDLPYIYNRASVFVYPSLYEGFGLPPLEAMACGVPVITANNSSLPEVVGKAAFLIDPLNEKEIAEAIKKILLKPKIAQKLSLLGLEQVKKFSWEKAARETLKILEEVTGKNEKNTNKTE